ncbi:ATP-binding cassette domain-containing protein [Anaerocolumna sp. AGMB13025]|uniref:ATP-binding cassette domain-containing protein n=1 Tax=Anaerocolumna sp. AGMB13025 TaxID=3039116 RepID=UPI00241BF1DC|nr:ATP-binding cassette domain-containing protein [Anaerocolumna sp. AGMB13025]WFR60165.1 ATP-binding cassette domain-containing protein [Anaerocolumna sp. AGMB13025]
MGPNGAGKSILANVIMGHPGYSVTDGHLYFEEDDITEAKTNERGKKGLLLSNQAPEEIPGITMENFLKSTRTALTEEK